MKWDTPARSFGSSREPAPIQKPSATERTPGTRSETTRSPVASSLSSCFCTRGWYRRAISERSTTFMYMNTVGVAELRQNLSRYLRRVARGERLIVTDQNRPVAELGPPPTTGGELDRLIAEGRVSRLLRRGLPEPL